MAGPAAAAVLIPNGMAYGYVAALSPAAGLYTALGGATVTCALFTSTRVVAVGPTAVMAIMTFTAVGNRTHGDPGRALALAAGLALLTRAVCLPGAVVRLGAFSELLSAPVMLGYLAGSGVVVIAGQAKKLVGVTVPESGAIVQIWHVAPHLDQAHPLTATLGGGSLATLVLLRRHAPRLPAALVVLLGAVLISSVGRLAERGVAVVGGVAAALPVPALRPISTADIWALLPPAAAMALVASTELGRAAGGMDSQAHREERLSANRELAALGAASAAARPARRLRPGSQFLPQRLRSRCRRPDPDVPAGERRPRLLALLAGAPLAARLPLAALAAVAVGSAIRLVDVGGFLRIWRRWRAEGMIALVAAAGVVGLGALRGLLIAVALAVWQLGRRAARPHDAVLAFAGPDEPPREVGDRDSHHPDVLIYRVDAPLVFANADRVRERVFRLAIDCGPELRWVILDAEAFFHLVRHRRRPGPAHRRSASPRLRIGRGPGTSRPPNDASLEPLRGWRDPTAAGLLHRACRLPSPRTGRNSARVEARKSARLDDCGPRPATTTTTNTCLSRRFDELGRSERK